MEGMMKLLKSWDPSDSVKIERIINRPALDFFDDKIYKEVEQILRDIREKKEEALLYYTEKFDGVKLLSENLRVKEEEVEEAYSIVGDEDIGAIRKALQKIEKFHKMEKANSWLTTSPSGTILGQIYHPIEKVGVYVPGGTAPLFSTVLMACIPAKLAGVKEISICSPPNSHGKANPYIIIAADLIKVANVYKVGGAQAIAAFAFGTEQIPKVDKIVGPGNLYVTLAKKLVYGFVSIDMIAGPSEILILADRWANSKYIASDLLSQAEHDISSIPILITDSWELAINVNQEINLQLENLKRSQIITSSLSNKGAIILVKDLVEEGVKLINLFAPEHLELLVENPFELLGSIHNAGAIFIGENSPEAIGDYFAGPNHILPTSGTAKFFSPLSVDDFVKKSSLISYGKFSLEKDAEDIAKLAELEGLDAHAQSVRMRITKK
jgi:histidinol dehydrogenase